MCGRMWLGAPLRWLSRPHNRTAHIVAVVAAAGRVAGARALLRTEKIVCEATFYRPRWAPPTTRPSQLRGRGSGTICRAGSVELAGAAPGWRVLAVAAKPVTKLHSCHYDYRGTSTLRASAQRI